MVQINGISELRPNDSHKSFYGKALILTKDNGDTVLRSYSTEVCKVTKDGKFVKLWDGYSATTMRHINSFLDYMGIQGGGKKWWDSL